MAKACLCGCGYPRFSNGYAVYCQHKRTDEKWLKKLSTQKDKFGIKKEKKAYSGINDLGVDKESDLYKILWEHRDHISFLSGLPINIKEGSTFWYNIFAHVLAKGQAKYPKFKLYSENIIFLTPDEHFLLDHSSQDKRDEYAVKYNCDWGKIDELKEKLIREYELTKDF